jgi:hypothetical protein
VLGLTSIHHVYGAYVYRTHWRLHAVVLAAAAAVVIAGARAVMRSQNDALRRFGRRTLAVVTLTVPIAGLGLFEGGYNHLAKNLLFFGGASKAWLLALFPAPTYELPNDFLFELTGVFQVVPAVVAAWNLLAMLRSSSLTSGIVKRRNDAASSIAGM